MRPLRRSALLPAMLLFLGPLLCAWPAAANGFLFANISWCATGSYQQPSSSTVAFSVRIADRRFAAQAVGDTVYEPFYFGDNTLSAVMALTVTEVHPDEGWGLAQGQVVHQYSPAGEPLVSAGIEGCCRIDELNNRSGEPYKVRVLVSRSSRVGECSPKIFLPPIRILYALPGEALDFTVPVSSNEPIRCRLVEGDAAGGGPSPSGMILGGNNCVISWGNGGAAPFPFWTAQVEVQGYDGYDYPSTQHLLSSGVTDFLLRFLPDTAPPVCRVDRIDAGPPTRLSIFVQDAQTGLAAIDVLSQTNATVDIPHFFPGATDSLIVVGTKTDQSQPARIQLRVRDRAGNVTECDPVLTGEARGTGRPESHIFPGIPSAEHVVTVFNGDPGLQQIRIDVNGRKFTVAGLGDGEERTIDIGSAVVPGTDSTVTLTSHGKPGGTAAIMIWDGRSE
jgi:hypothetical protein